MIAESQSLCLCDSVIFSQMWIFGINMHGFDFFVMKNKCIIVMKAEQFSTIENQKIKVMERWI